MYTSFKSKIPEQAIPDKYSINFLWINRTLNDNDPFITKHLTEKELKSDFLEKITKWKKANPAAEVNIWYDSHFVSNHALNATKKALDSIAQGVNLRDIREMDIVKHNPDAFSDNVSLYFRVDLLKLIILLNSMDQEKYEAAIFCDHDVGHLYGEQKYFSKAELFDEETMARLNTIGIQVNRDSLGKNENKFIQIINNPNTINALKAYIDANLSRIITALNLTNETIRKRALLGLCTAVYNTMTSQLFPLMLGGLHEIKVKANLFDEAADEEAWIIYDPLKHGSLPLGNYYIRNYSDLGMILDGNDPTIPGKVKPSPACLRLPSTEGYEFGRTDLNTRIGLNHYEDIKNLVNRAPADGSATYKYKSCIGDDSTGIKLKL